MKFEIAPISTEIEANWDDARLYCFSLNIDGKIGWRLPTIEELNEIYQSENDFEINGHYWSSTEDTDDYAWYRYFGNGLPYTNYKHFDGVSYVRAIRSFV